jgi:hypothetical protein
MKRGLKPAPRHVLASSLPHTARATESIPPNFLIIPEQMSCWYNTDACYTSDVATGDCVTAEQAFAKACHSPEIFITDNEVERWAKAHGVWDGANIPDVMTWMQTDGFTQDGHTYDDGPHYSVNWMDEPTLQSAISQGPVSIGVAADQLQAVVTPGTNGWFATGFHEDQNWDHNPSLCGYGTISWLAEKMNVNVRAGVDGNQTGYAMFTWNSIGIIDFPSLKAITGEAWLRVPTTIIV